MESSYLESWQYENFSSAELSPPTSPVSSPSSPLFYDGGSNPPSPSFGGSIKGIINNDVPLNKLTLQQSQKPVSSVLSNRAKVATNLLEELERLHYENDQIEFGMSHNEESVDLNMDLFEELEDIEFTPPLFPSDSEFKNNGRNSFEVPSVPAGVSTSKVASPNIATVPSTHEKFSAEYKAILESLGGGNKISTISVGDECLVPVEFIGRPSANNGGIGEEEVESMDLDGIIISDDLTLINENELFSLGELSAELATEENSNGSDINTTNATTVVNGILPYWAKDMVIPLDSLDTEMNRNADTLDALLKGDVSAAKNVITTTTTGYPSTAVVVKEALSPVSYYSDDEGSVVEEVVPVVEIKPVVEAKKKERRGRKPGKHNKDSLTYIKDKSLRKKEQNKTAATRYRQKKKQELVGTLADEEELQIIHDGLESEKQKLGSEIKVIRSLLRDMISLRKKRVIPASSAVTASALVQAQKLARSRK